MAFISDWKRVLRRVFSEAALPIAAAVAWGIVVGMQKHSLIDGVSAGGIAFFFVLSLQGQILRVAKNVRDEQDAEEFRTSFASIQQGLEELRKQQPSATAIEETAPPTGPTETVDRLMADAKRAFASGSYYAAATLAAVAFERAIRDTIPDARAQRLSTRAILNLLTLGGHEGQLEEFTTLLKLRNNLVHAEGNPIGADKLEAEQLIEAFQNGTAQVRALQRRR